MDYVELIKIAGLEGILPLIAVITLLTVIFKKVIYIYSIDEFDEILIPQNKVRIYNIAKYLLSIVGMNLLVFVFSVSISETIILSVQLINNIGKILLLLISISLLGIIIIIIITKVRSKKAQVKRSIIEDNILVADITFFHIICYVFYSVSIYYSTIKYGIFNNIPITSNDCFISLSMFFIIYGYVIYMLIRWFKKNRQREAKFFIAVVDEKYYVLKCRDENTLILGDSNLYETSTKLILYNIKEQKYQKIEKVI